MAKKAKKTEEEGVDLSTAAELWSEDELRELIREEALKLIIGGQQGTQAPFVNPPHTTTPQWHQTPGWVQQSTGNITYNDCLNDSGHYHSTNNLAYAAMTVAC